MSDPIVITAIIASIGSLILSIISHVKYSKCWGAEVMMKRSSPTTPDPTSSEPASRFTPPTETTPIISDPIPIPQTIAPVVNTPPRQSTI